MVRPRTILQVGIAALVAGAACTKSPTGPSSSDGVTGFLAGVQTVDGAVVATQESGAAPVAAGGPAATAVSIASAIDGGSNLVSLHGSAPFSQIIISVANGSGNPPTPAATVGVTSAATSGAIAGFYLLTLPAATTDQSLVVNFGGAVPFAAFDLNYQLISASGAAGAAAVVRTTLLQSGVGDVQVTASWDQLTDLDLHVVEPNGNEVFWAAPISSTGGALDLDSNMACLIDGKNTEDVRWTSHAPAGAYIVRLDYFSNCLITANTNYVVTVNNGGVTTVYTGSFAAGDQDGGNIGSGRTITTFTHTATSVPALFAAPSAVSSVKPSAEKLRLAGIRR